MSIQLTGKIEEDWQRSLGVWKHVGRVEDLPRDTRVPKYVPSDAKILGQKFASTYKDDYKIVVSKLASNDEIEILCAFEILELLWSINLATS